VAGSAVIVIVVVVLGVRVRVTVVMVGRAVVVAAAHLDLSTARRPGLPAITSSRRFIPLA
jgi:hypothetical protein